MERIKLLIAYDGTRFAGWQTQAGARTVQATIEKALETITGRPTSVVGAGRTDAGVHATGQAAHFDVERMTLPPVRWADALNGHLPHDVRILKSEPAPPDFHARYSAVLRVYRYYLYCAPVGFPHLRHCVWRLRRPLPLDALNRYAALVAGEHDFTSFAAAGDPAASKVRTVSASCFTQRGDFYVYHIAAPSFLWRMVRTIVGTIVESVLCGRSEEEFRAIFDARDRAAAGRTAPARGLFLEEVRYR